MLNMGRFCLNGSHGLAVDHAAALSYLTKCAAMNSVKTRSSFPIDAKVELCHMHLRGLGIPPDATKARAWAQKAYVEVCTCREKNGQNFAQTFGRAASAYAGMLLEGEGGPLDEEAGMRVLQAGA